MTTKLTPEIVEAGDALLEWVFLTNKDAGWNSRTTPDVVVRAAKAFMDAREQLGQQAAAPLPIPEEVEVAAWNRFWREWQAEFGDTPTIRETFRAGFVAHAQTAELTEKLLSHLPHLKQIAAGQQAAAPGVYLRSSDTVDAAWEKYRRTVDAEHTTSAAMDAFWEGWSVALAVAPPPVGRDLQAERDEAIGLLRALDERGHTQAVWSMVRKLLDRTALSTPPVRGGTNA